MNEYVFNQLEAVNQGVDDLLSTAPLIIRKYTKHLAKAKGKGMRALSVLISALDEEENIHPDAITIAISIELLHLATLVHDDVMDDASTRRGVETLHAKYGRKTAVICGDYLLALSMHQLTSLENKDRFAHADFSEILMDLALGELKQHINNGNLNLSISEYLEIIEGKTARLFEGSFYAGAMTYLDDEEEILKYRKFGYYLGLMFQIADDCMDYDSSVSKALKPVQSDFEQGVLTLPLLYAFEADPSLRKKSLTQELVNAIVKEFKGVDKAKQKTKEYYDEAIAILKSMDINEKKREHLTTLLNKTL